MRSLPIKSKASPRKDVPCVYGTSTLKEDEKIMDGLQWNQNSNCDENRDR